MWPKLLPKNSQNCFICYLSMIAHQNPGYRNDCMVPVSNYNKNLEEKQRRQRYRFQWHNWLTCLVLFTDMAQSTWAARLSLNSSIAGTVLNVPSKNKMESVLPTFSSLLEEKIMWWCPSSSVTLPACKLSCASSVADMMRYRGSWRIWVSSSREAGTLGNLDDLARCIADRILEMVILLLTSLGCLQ